MSHITGGPDLVRVELPFHPDKAIIIPRGFAGSQMSDIFSGVTNCRHHLSHDGPVSPKEVNKRNRKHKNEPAKKTARQKEYFNVTYKFFIAGEFISPKEIKEDKNDGYDGIVDAIF